MNTLDYIVQKFQIDINRRSPIEIPNVSRQVMAETMNELDFTVGVEVGVAEGRHAQTLCAFMPNLKLYGIDAWESYNDYQDYVQESLDIFEMRAHRRLKNYNCELIKKFSMDAVRDFKDKSLDFCYIDGAHDFKNVAMDICEWVKKVRTGGIFYGHDYTRSHRIAKWQCNVKDVVNAYAYSHKIIPWFILNTKVAREGSYSWMWVVND